MMNPQAECDIQLEIFDTLIRAAMLEKEEKAVPDAPDITPYNSMQIQEKIISMYRKKETDESKIRNIIQRKKQLKMIGLAAASFVLIVTLGISIAMAVSESIRMSVVRLVINHDQEKQMYTVSAEREEVTFKEIPIEWKGDYYLTYLPDGYELQIAEKSLVQYCDPEKHRLKDTKAEGVHLITSSITFVEIPDKSYFTFPEEKCYLEAITVGDHSGIRAVYPEIDQLETIIWSADGKMFEVRTFGLDFEETIRIASGIYKKTTN